MFLHRLFLAFFAATFLASPAFSAPKEAEKVVWSATLDPTDARPGEGGRVVLRAKLAAGWHVYAPTTPPGGPIATKIEILPNKVLSLAGKITQPKPLRKKDEGFGIFVETFTENVAFGLPIKIATNAPTEGVVIVRVKWQACNERMCLPPATKEIPVKMTLNLGLGPRADHLKPNTVVPPQDVAKVAPQKPVSQNPTGQNKDLLSYLGAAFVAGLFALLTPCVFPMILLRFRFLPSKTKTGAVEFAGRSPIAQVSWGRSRFWVWWRRFCFGPSTSRESRRIRG